MIINDPVHGFIEIPEGLPSLLTRHPLFFRLSRIRQLGPTAYVYPGGRHTRFEHSLGAYHLACKAVDVLRKKGHSISADEALGVECAMLLHDTGHGPMSHALEGILIRGVSHESISLMCMERLNGETGGKLDTAISIFKDQYPHKFLHELITSQLDMDRMDYLCRDSFFTGVREGNIGAARIIAMLNVAHDKLAVEGKGIYTIENYLMSRRLMYWQVYLHKTVMAAQELLRTAIRRAQLLARTGHDVPASPSLAYFLRHDVTAAFAEEHPEWFDHFLNLDDSDIDCAIKQWAYSPDRVLALLARDYADRNLYKVKTLSSPLSAERLSDIRRQMAAAMHISEADAECFVRNAEVSQMLYSTADDHIQILFKDGTLRDISEISELLATEMVDKACRRYFLFYQRGVAGFVPDF